MTEAAPRPGLGLEQVRKAIDETSCRDELGQYERAWMSGQTRPSARVVSSEQFAYVLYRLRLRYRLLGDNPDAEQSSSADVATPVTTADAVPAAWIDELHPVLRTNNPKLRLAVVRCESPQSHSVLSIYASSAGPVALFRAFTLQQAPDWSSPNYPADDNEYIDVDPRFDLVTAVTHPAPRAALVLRGEAADATFGAECRCSRQLITVAHARRALQLASTSRNRSVSLGLLHRVPRR